MRKITGAFLAAMLCVQLCGTSVFAGSMELEIEPRLSDGDNLYAVQYDTAILMNGAFDPRTMTPDSQVRVEFDCDDPPEERCAVELIWQSWGSHSTNIKNWSVIKPSEYSDDYAVFDHADIVAACGTDDFAEVYTVLVRDTGRPLTVTGITVSNLDIPEDVFTTTAYTEPEVTEEETSAETETPVTETEAARTVPKTETTPASAETPADVTLPDPEKPPVQKIGKNNKVLLTVVGIVMAAAVIAAVIVLIRKKRRKDTRFY